MIVNWTVNYELDFSEEDIKSIASQALEKNWNDDMILYAIYTFVEKRYDTELYFAWGVEQTKIIYDEIRRRMGGVQISMFDKENENEI